MCTVTFIPGRDQCYLTSNRDEKSWRSPALLPAAYQFSSGQLLFPKDGDAGGTWIAAHENGNAIIFLNGAFIAHTPQPPYRKSRGLILLDLIDSPSPWNSFLAIQLNNIEPFTAILWDQQRLYECRWDGEQKHQKELNPGRPHIWSSVTLYTEAVVKKRKQWFSNWLHQHPHPGPDEILGFHQFTGDGDRHNDLLMDRNGQVYTVSVTRMTLRPQATQMHYLDLKNNKTFDRELVFEKSMAGR
ncbi:MAG: NRDE family protein [Candidatus Pseudobacter hemicellulosilyticus]|uniref:NRDE family protein n=1 Tax=Candidatus Pseudobacter hemicellulosilyticus TaxID=3121375 RepID=A0AAJ5WQR6_9BACT|nr:MAG: NRDE family protein [Pseudobacter sp.]